MNAQLLVPDLATVLVECAVFAVVLGGLGWFALPRLRAVVDEQQRRTADTEAAAEQAEARRDQALAQARRLLVDARKEARVIIDRGHAKHDRLVAQGRRDGQAEYEWRATRIDRQAQRPASRSA